MKTKKTSVKFINDKGIDENTYLWRYIDTHKFLSFILNKSLFFTRLDKFEDQKEGTRISHLFYQNCIKALENDPEINKMVGGVSVEVNGGMMNKIDEKINQIQKSNFANCWFMANDYSESVAMWNLYSSPNSVAIKIKYSDFKNIISEKGLLSYYEDIEVVCSPIKYVDFISPKIKGTKLPDSIFIKDISFQHEKEFRIILKKEFKKIPPIDYHPSIHRKKSEKNHAGLHDKTGIELDFIDFEKFPYELIFHPKSPEWVKNNINKILETTNTHLKTHKSILELN
ncbi:MAG: hypothetical protein ACPG45_07795 [Flavobacteriaceae bacterium]|mgnify:CR=1 FL=1